MAKKYYLARAMLYSSTAVAVYELMVIAAGKAKDSAAELGIQRKPMFAPKPPSEPSLYKNCPADGANSREIRLLFLRPARSVLERIHCRMKTFSLDDPDKPLYTALSYTWGEPIRRSRPLTSLRGLYQEARTLFWRYCLPQRRTIFINGEAFSVSRNLATALRYIREDKAPMYLWIDAVCIDQSNDREKAEQVGLMGDIYSMSEETCIWLGPSADGSDQVMSYLGSMSPKEIKDEDFDLPRSKLFAFYCRTWWTRIWIVQELLLSKSPRIRCGRREVDFRCIDYLLIQERQSRMRARREWRKRIPTVRPMWVFMPPSLPIYTIILYRIQKLGRERKIPYEALVLSTEMFKSSLPRDRFYGLLGLSHDWVRDYVKPSYSEPDSRVFSGATAFLLQEANNLAILAQNHVASKKPGFPSWSLDLSSRATGSELYTPLPRNYDTDGGFSTWLRLTPFDLNTVKPGASPTGLAGSLHNYIYPLMATCRGIYGSNPKFDDNLRTLTVTGLVFDTVKAADVAGKTYTVDHSDILDALAKPDDAEERELIHQLERNWRNLAFMNGPPDPYTGLPGGKVEALIRTMMADNIRAVDGSSTQPTGAFVRNVDKIISSKAAQKKNMRGDLSHYDVDVVLDYSVFAAALMKYASWRSFIVTDRGFLGLAPRDVRNGDVICVVRGSQKPLVLRPLPHGRYQLVGECYVHGIMDGSFARSQGWGAVRKFCIE